MIAFLNWGQAIQVSHSNYCRLPGKGTRMHLKASVTAYFKSTCRRPELAGSVPKGTVF